MIIDFIKNPSLIKVFFWDLSQSIFGANREKCRIYRDVVQCPPDGNILDFGCATGITARAFFDCKYLGVDINPISIMWARIKYKKFPNLNFECVDINLLQENNYARILCAGTGHHLSDDEIIRFHYTFEKLLSDNGCIYFIDIVKTIRDSMLMRFLMKIDQGKFIRTSDEYVQLLTGIHSLRIQECTVKRADGWFTKPSFVCIKLVKNS